MAHSSSTRCHISPAFRAHHAAPPPSATPHQLLHFSNSSSYSLQVDYVAAARAVDLSEAKVLVPSADIVAQGTVTYKIRTRTKEDRR